MPTFKIKKNMINFIKLISSRVITFFLLVAVAINLASSFKRIYTSSMVKVLNRLRPSSYELFIDYAQGKKNTDKNLIEDYIVYYKEILKYILNRPDGYGMLGFCYYQLGNTKKAIASYQKAIKLNSRFFWFYYNLGSIYLKEKNYNKALEYYNMAIETIPEQAYIFIESSEKIYIPIIDVVYSDMDRKRFILGQLKKYYLDTALIIKSIEILSHDYNNKLILQKLDQVRLQIY